MPRFLYRICRYTTPMSARVATFTIFLITALGGTNGSEAATWVLVGDQPTLTVEVDRDGIASEGALVKAWFRWNYNPAQIALSKQKPFQSMKELNYFDCRKRQYAIAQRIGYEERDALGQTVFSASVRASDLEYSEVVPESIGESMLTYVCKQPRKKS